MVGLSTGVGLVRLAAAVRVGSLGDRCEESWSLDLADMMPCLSIMSRCDATFVGGMCSHCKSKPVASSLWRRQKAQEFFPPALDQGLRSYYRLLWIRAGGNNS